MYRKVGLFFLSLWLLFLSIIIITIDMPIYFGDDYKFVSAKELLSQNIIPNYMYFLFNNRCYFLF